MIILCLGYMSFTSTFFWISLLLQNVHKSSAIQIAGELLPSVIAGLATNAACGLLLDRVNNRLLMGVSVVCYTTSFILLSYMREGSAYWAFIFPSLIMMGTAVGVQYNVVNVGLGSLPAALHCLPHVIYADRECRCMWYPRFLQTTSPSRLGFSAQQPNYAPP